MYFGTNNAILHTSKHTPGLTTGGGAFRAERTHSRRLYRSAYTVYPSSLIMLHASGGWGV